ncbi:hypothetical protein [Paracidobacterium acidisoli]|nr:hypothetical protein [Paracidobacterium acidisoli]MBT9332041.1 hypothetical protein [Paracidobacterium acidisoli]
MSDDFVLKFASSVFKIVFIVSLGLPSYAQQTAETQSSQGNTQAMLLPDAPSLQDAQGDATRQSERSQADAAIVQAPIGPMPPIMTKTPLTFHDKFRIYTHQAFGPPALVFPALGAGLRMADPPKDYPRDWVDGGGAFGRLYGSALATQTSKRTAGFLAESLLHEDPRYLPAAEGSNGIERILHAVGYSFVDRTDSGGHTLAFSNFASATAGGFVGMTYLPDGFNDAHHAGQRVGTEFLGIVIANISKEFAPQWAPVVRKLGIPKIVPSWWVPERAQHP